MDKASMKVAEKVESNCDGYELFRIAKEKVKESCGMSGVNCL